MVELDKVFLIDKITAYRSVISSDTVKFDLEINKKDSRVKDITDLDDLEIETPVYFGMKGCAEKEDKIVISYIVPSDYKLCSEGKKYSNLFKFELLYNFLKSDPLNNFLWKNFFGYK